MAVLRLTWGGFVSRFQRSVLPVPPNLGLRPRLVCVALSALCDVVSVGELFASEGDAGDLLEVVDEAEGVPVC